jgi:hypothetical protein
MNRDVARRWARWVGIGRAGLGATALLAPTRVGQPWYGRGSGRPVHKVMTRSIGARDVALGLGLIWALDRSGSVRGWVEAGAVADAGDLVTTLLDITSMPRLVRWTVVPSTAGLVGLAALLAPSVD